jgi:hypothetical protein
LGDVIQQSLVEGISNGTLCKELQDFANKSNISSLLTPSAITEIKAFCNQSVAFETIFGTLNSSLEPSSSPSESKSKSPSSLTKCSKSTKISSTISVPIIEGLSDDEVHNVMGGLGGLFALCIFGVWGCLRCLPCCVGLVTLKKERGHLYDILLIVDDSEELILRNIRHEDISYFRDSKTQDMQLTWETNDTDDVLEMRFEVEFFDRYDLMGRGLDRHVAEKGVCNVNFEMSEDKAIWRENYSHHAYLETGMIIRINPANYSKNVKEDNCSYDLGCDSTAPRFKGNKLFSILEEDIMNRCDSAELREMGESSKILSSILSSQNSYRRLNGSKDNNNRSVSYIRKIWSVGSLEKSHSLLSLSDPPTQKIDAKPIPKPSICLVPILKVEKRVASSRQGSRVVFDLGGTGVNHNSSGEIDAKELYTGRSNEAEIISYEESVDFQDDTNDENLRSDKEVTDWSRLGDILNTNKTDSSSTTSLIGFNLDIERRFDDNEKTKDEVIDSRRNSTNRNDEEVLR